MISVSFRMSKHPTECGGALEGCLHCQKVKSDDHDPARCVHCEEDWITGVPRDFGGLAGVPAAQVREWHLLATLAQCRWGRRKAAKLLQVSERTIARWCAAMEDERGCPLPAPSLPGMEARRASRNSKKKK